MQYRRITGNEVFFDALADMKTRLGTLETQPTGNVVVRDTLSTTDPETGVSTLIGVLPDGTTGLQQFVNDVIPPDQPSAPLLAPAIDAIAVEWDGLDITGGAQPKDYDRTEIMYRSSGSQEAWVFGGVIYGATRALIVNLIAGVHYEVRLVSYDKNDNASIPSGIRSETAAAVLDSSDVAEAIEEVREAAATAVANSASAQTAAATAQTAAENAARDALAAADLAAGAGKGSTVFSPTAPTDAASTTGSTLWIDISGTPPKNTPNRWDGKKWVAITDTVATNAAAKAADAEARANAAEAAAVAAANAAGLAQTAANGKNKVWYLDTAPAGNGHSTNDIWFDAANGNRPMRWNGTKWVTAQDASIGVAQSAATSALTAANGKNKIVFSTSDASGTDGYIAGDMWMKRDSAGSIIGQWEFTTSWEKRTIGEDVLGNLSAGKIVSGTIHADRLAANDIRAKIIAADKINAVDILASNSITATNGIIGSLDANIITAGTLNAARIGAQTITADKVILGQGSNLISDPSFLSTASNTVRGSKSTGTWTFGIDSETGINSAKTLTETDNNAFKFGLVTRSTANAANMIPVTPGERYLLSANVSTDISASVRWNVETVQADGVVGYSAASPSNTGLGRRTVEYEYVVPAGVVAFNPVLACLTTGVNWVIDAGAMAVKKTEGRLIVDGAVTAKKLEADLVLTTRIVAGDPTGVRAEMAPEGFKVFGKASGDTTSTGTYEIVRLGVADTNDMFAIADKDGITQASISENGTVSGKELYASEDIVFKGKSFNELLWDLPRGHIVSGFRYNSSENNAKAGGAWVPYLRVEVELERNRLYKITTSPIKFGQLPDGTASLAIVQTTGAVATTTNGTIICQVDVNNGGDGNAVSLGEYVKIAGGVEDGPEGDTVMVSYLLMFRAYVREFGIRATAISPVRLMVEDMGPLRNTQSGQYLDGPASVSAPTPVAPPAKTTYTKTLACNFIKSYTGNGAYYNYNVNKGYQGLSPAGYGNMKTIMKFPDMTGTLSGSTVHSIKVYLYFEHWYYNAGGTARIALAGGGDTTTYGGQNPVISSGGWPKPGGRWVTIPSAHYSGFKSGTYRGITLEGDGTYGTYGIAHPGKIEIKYTK